MTVTWEWGLLPLLKVSLTTGLVMNKFMDVK